MLNWIKKAIKNLNNAQEYMNISKEYKELLIKNKVLLIKNKKLNEEFLEMAETALERGRSLLALQKAIIDYFKLENADPRLFSKLEVFELEKFVNSSKIKGEVKWKK